MSRLSTSGGGTPARFAPTPERPTRRCRPSRRVLGCRAAAGSPPTRERPYPAGTWPGGRPVAAWADAGQPVARTQRWSRWCRRSSSPGAGYRSLLRAHGGRRGFVIGMNPVSAPTKPAGRTLFTSSVTADRATQLHVLAPAVVAVRPPHPSRSGLGRRAGGRGPEGTRCSAGLPPPQAPSASRVGARGGAGAMWSRRRWSPPRPRAV